MKVNNDPHSPSVHPGESRIYHASSLRNCTRNEMFCIQQRLQLLTESYLENGEEPFTVDILKEMTSKYLVYVFF